MKLSFLLLFLSIKTISAQQPFSVVHDSVNETFYFTYEGKSLYFDENYVFNVDFSNVDKKIELIESLLKYEGDTRILNVKPQFVHNAMSSSKYYGKKEICSVQVYALFLINYIYYGDFWYAPFPVLVNEKNKNEETCQGKIVDLAYKKYHRWFKKLTLNKHAKTPLKNGWIQWYR